MPYASCVILIVSIFYSPVAWGAKVLPFKRANKPLLPSSLSLGQVKLTIMIEDPRIAEQREKYGIEDDSGVSREELAAALVDVRRRLSLQSSSQFSYGSTCPTVSTLGADSADSLSGHSLMNSVELASQDKLHVLNV
jgi:hypothetical protein